MHFLYTLKQHSNQSHTTDLPLIKRQTREHNMRILECNHHDHHGQDLTRKLRPLMPRPFSSCSTNMTTFSTTPTPCFCLHNHNISGGYGVKREIMSTMAPLVSSRWNPTPEQLQALEEMYKRGTRTPSAEQIQQIAAKLRRFGKIEGKNVFYWFQNHKARERQKKRRQQELLAGKKLRQLDTTPELRNESGLSRRYLEIGQAKKFPTPSNCSTAIQEECGKKDGWAQLDEKELQTITGKSSTETCSPLGLSMQQITAQKALFRENAKPFVPLNITKLLPIKTDDFFGKINAVESGIKEKNQTLLQLFPTRSSNKDLIGATLEEINVVVDDDDDDVSSVGISKSRPSQFFEFLPTKN